MTRDWYTKRGVMIATVALRMVTSLATPMIVAAALEPADFGFFAVYFALGTLIGLVTNFGYPLALLQDVGRDNRQARSLLVACLLPKGAVGAALFGGAYIWVALFWAAENHGWYIAAVILISLYLSSFSDLCFVVLRAVDKFRTEFWIVLVQMVVQVALFLLLVPHQSLFLFAITLAFVRCVFGLFGIIETFRVLPADVTIQKIQPMAYLRRSFVLMLDGFIVNAAANLDGLIVAGAMGLHFAGLYQAAARVVQTPIPFGAVLASISIPRIAAASQDDLPKEVRNALIEFGVLSIFFAAMTVFFGPLYVYYVLGPEYEELNGLWPWFSAFILLRFFCSGLGAVLAVLHHGFVRTCILATTALSPLVLIWMLPTGSSLFAVVILNLLGAIGLCVGHGWLLMRTLRRHHA